MRNPETENEYFKVLDDVKKLYKHDINLVKKKRKIRNRNLLYKILILIAMIFTLIFAGLIYYTNSEKYKVIKGSYIHYGHSPSETSENIEDLSYTDVSDKIDKFMYDYNNKKINLIYESVNINTTLFDMGVTLDPSAAITSVKNYLYGPYIYDSVLKHLNKSEKIINVTPDVHFDNQKFESFISSEPEIINKKPQDAEIFIEDGNIKIKKEVLGYTINKQKFIDTIISTAKSYKSSINIPVDLQYPSITENSLKSLLPEKIMSSFEIYYGGFDNSRKENIRLGASMLNNILLAPKEEFEFFKYIGNPTIQRGFKPAGTYHDGKATTGIGGGLCQVSTVLYNAALLADLNITQRSPHNLTIHYVSLGLDANVSYSDTTLKFVNNTDKYILIKSTTDSDILTFSVYGYMPEGKAVKVYTKNAGYNTVDTYREIYMNENLIKTDYLGRSKYRNSK